MKKALAFFVLFMLINCSVFSQNDVWGKLIYFGARVGVYKHFFFPGNDYFSSAPFSLKNTFNSFNGAFQISVHPFDFLEFQTELMYSNEKNIYSGGDYIQYSGNYYRVNITEIFDMNILTIPILVKYIYKTDNFPIDAMIGFIGVYFNMPVGEAKMAGELTLPDYNFAASVSEKFNFETSHGFVFGCGYEFELKHGIIFVDGRYIMDFDDTKIDIEQEMTSIFKKSGLHISVGYKIGFIQNKKF